MNDDLRLALASALVKVATSAPRKHPPEKKRKRIPHRIIGGVTMVWTRDGMVVRVEMSAPIAMGGI